MSKAPQKTLVVLGPIFFLHKSLSMGTWCMEVGNSPKSCASERPQPPGPPTGTLGCDQIGPILDLISPLLSSQKGPKWPPIVFKGYPEYTRVMFWVTAQDLGPLGPFLVQKRGEISSKIGPIWSHP